MALARRPKESASARERATDRPVACVCFGEVLWDVFDVDPPARTSGARFVREIGGAPANVATVLARLGIGVRLVGGVGDDRFGRDLRDALAQEGIDVTHLIGLPNRTGLAFVRRDASGEPSFLFYRRETADVSLTSSHIVPGMGQTRFALVGTSTLMTWGLRSATNAFMGAVRVSGGALVVDLNVRAHMWNDFEEMRARVATLVRRAAIVKASGTDLVALGGTLRRGEQWLADHAPSSVHVHTRGGAGARVTGPFGTVHVPLPRQGAPCVDATGAGDAFIAGVLARLVSDRAWLGTEAFGDPRVWQEALTLGHRLGEKAIGKPGAVKGVTGLAPLRRALARIAARPRSQK